MGKQKIETPAAVPEPKRMTFDVSPSPEAIEGLTLRQEATLIVVKDQISHSYALQFIRDTKQLKRRIEDHWSRTTRLIDNLKKDLLNLKRDDLAPVEQAISIAESVALDYEARERRRAQEEQDRQRREAEQRAREDREAELARFEREALKAEQSSAALSAREQIFAQAVEQGHGHQAAAKLAGFAEPLKAAERLMSTPKIVKAIAAMQSAKEIRQQAAAKREQPLDVVTRKVEANLGKAAGTSTRMYYSCKVVDLTKFRAALLAGVIPIDSVAPDASKLNDQATALKELFEQAYPGCQLIKTPRIAG